MDPLTCMRAEMFPEEIVQGLIACDYLNVDPVSKSVKLCIRHDRIIMHLIGICCYRQPDPVASFDVRIYAIKECFYAHAASAIAMCLHVLRNPNPVQSHVVFFVPIITVYDIPLPLST